MKKEFPEEWSCLATVPVQFADRGVTDVGDNIGHPDLIISKHGYKSISGIEGYLGSRHWTTILLEIHLLIFSLK